MKHSLMDLAGVSVTFGGRGGSRVEALRDVSLSIEEGELLILVGESGSGKTTLGRVLASLQRPTGGRMRFRGDDVQSMKGESALRYRRAVQMLHQDPYTALNPALPIEQSLVPGILAWQPGKSRAQEKAARLLGLVGLEAEEVLRKYPHQLSGGQRQRVAIARAISIDPELVILDEPASMIDASLRIGILDTLLKIRKEFGTAYIFITHDLAIARYLCEKGGGGRIVVLYLGSIMEMGEYREVINAPANPYTIALLSSALGWSDMSEENWQKLLIAKQGSGCRFSQRCFLAQELCSAEEPKLLEVRSQHFSACHFAGTLKALEPRGKKLGN